MLKYVELCSLSWIIRAKQQSWISWIMGEYNKVSEATTAAVALRRGAV